MTEPVQKSEMRDAGVRGAVCVRAKLTPFNVDGLG
jgi:hypothetical protein